MKLLFIFTVLTIVNVIFSTIKSIVTIKSGKTVASLISALYYGYYNIVLIYTVADFPLWQKVAVTFFCNLVGVWLVKWGEEKARKDRLWLVKITIPVNYSDIIKKELNNNNIVYLLVLLIVDLKIFLILSSKYVHR